VGPASFWRKPDEPGEGATISFIPISHENNQALARSTEFFDLVLMHKFGFRVSIAIVADLMGPHVLNIRTVQNCISTL